MTPTQQFIAQLTTLGISALAVLTTLATVYINDRRTRLASQFTRLDEYLREQRKVSAELLRLGTKVMSNVHKYWDESSVEKVQIQQVIEDVNILNRLSLELMFLSSILGDAAEKYMISVSNLTGYVTNFEDKANQQQGFDECIADCLRKGRRVYHIAATSLRPTITRLKGHPEWPDMARIEEGVDEMERRYQSSS